MRRVDHKIRIISGSIRGRKLFVPPGLDLRPTTHKVREALFDILSDRIVGATFLDLYAGTGAIGIEALSRGAKKASFVEHNRKQLQYLRKNLDLCAINEKSHVFGITVLDYLNGGNPSFDFVFLDPPYQSLEIEKLLPRFEQDDIISEEGALIIEHFHKHSLPQKIGGIHFLKKYRYGESVLSFYGKS